MHCTKVNIGGFQALPVVISGSGSVHRLAFSILGGPLRGILDKFCHLVADIGDLDLYGTKVPKKSATVNLSNLI